MAKTCAAVLEPIRGGFGGCGCSLSLSLSKKEKRVPVRSQEAAASEVRAAERQVDDGIAQV
jgi:hypothetical protein